MARSDCFARQLNVGSKREVGNHSLTPINTDVSGGRNHRYQEVMSRVVDVTKPLSNCISAALAGTLPGLFNERATRSPDRVAYREFDRLGQCWRDYTWESMRRRAARVQFAMQQEGLTIGDRVAILLPNGIDWVTADIAALGLGLVVVPLYAHDSAANLSYILNHSGARLLVVDTEERWRLLAQREEAFPDLCAVWVRELLRAAPTAIDKGAPVKHLDGALRNAGAATFQQVRDPSALATIIYTSGTTGRPKGAMLSHFALLWNAESTAKVIPPREDDLFLSHLPLPHAFERTVGYYLPMLGGATVAYARSTEEFAEDLKVVRPTVLLSVPRTYERVYGAIRSRAEGMPLGHQLLRRAHAVGWQRFEAAHARAPTPGLAARLAWPLLNRLIGKPVRNVFGGRLRAAVSGGAPLPAEVASFLVAMGVPLVEGYGLTEAGPVVTATSLDDIWPGSVGRPLAGIELAVSADQELLVRSPALMAGYWRDDVLTKKAVDHDGWLHTGDIAEIRDGRLMLRGRLHDIQVLATGEKVNAGLIEDAITKDRLFERVVVIGEGKPFLVAVCALNPRSWRVLARALDLDASHLDAPAVRKAVLARLGRRLADLPRHAQVKAVHLVLAPWTIESGLLTPSLKVRRERVEERYQDAIEALYAGHPTFR